MKCWKWLTGCGCVALMCGVSVADGATNEAPARIRIASWNVENLFDTEDDPATDGDDAFTPDGWVRWSSERYALKLEHLAEIIAKMRPDVLCLMEIENRRVLEDLQRTLREKQAYELPAVLHRDGNDPRGVDVAMLSRYPAVMTNWLPNMTRETLACDFEIGGRRLTVLANHWKSQAGIKEESDELRNRDASAVRRYLDGRLIANPKAAIIVAGDFNDQVTSSAMTGIAGLVLDKHRVLADKQGRLLFNLSGDLPANERCTYWYKPGKTWNSFDSINVSHGMLSGTESPAPWQVLENTYRVFKTPAQLDEDGHPIPFRFVRSKVKGNTFKTGYSDHFPVMVELEAR